MATVYPIKYANNSGGNSNTKANTNTISNSGAAYLTGSNNLSSIAAEKIIQSYKCRFVSQDQIEKWDSVYKSVEEDNSVAYKWHQTIKITKEIIDNNCLITLPNHKTFFDYDPKSCIVFVNDKFLLPTNYNIVNQLQIKFKKNVIKQYDTVSIIHLNRVNKISNYDTRLFALATVWTYSYTNTSSVDERDIIIDPS